MSKRAPEKERNSIFIIQYSYSNTNTNSNSDIMTNDETLNPPNSIGMSLVDSEPPPTPSPPIKWGPDQFEQLRRRMIEIENKTNWTYHDLEKTKVELEKTKTDLAAAQAELAVAKAAPGKGEANGVDPLFFTWQPAGTGDMDHCVLNSLCRSALEIRHRREEGHPQDLLPERTPVGLVPARHQRVFNDGTRRSSPS